MSFNPQFQKVGDILVYHNVITEEQLQKALSEQKETNEKLGQILINQDIISEADLVKAYSEQMGHKHVLENDLLALSEENVGLLSEEFARANHVIAMKKTDSGILVAMEDPEHLDAIDGISLTSIAVEKPKNISIKISRETMMRHGISIDDINRAVRNSSIEMPAGKLENNNFQKVIKVNQRAYLGKDIANIKIVSSSNPESYVRIGDIAEIVDGFEESEIELRFNKKPGSVIMVFRIANQNALDIASKVESYIEDKSKELPSGVELKTWNDESKYLKGRLDLLLKNAWIGLILVMFVLSLFLKPKLAFWVSLGIPISFLGAIWLFPFLDVSINMLSLFTFILVLGIVVDDAIVVGENFYKYKELGENSRDAAIKGTYEISKPVIFAILTTMATFSPMLFVEGASGKIWKIFPLVVIPILFFSLFESLTILPFHLAHSKDRSS